MTKVRFIVAFADDNGAPEQVIERFHTYEQLRRDLPFILKAQKRLRKDIRTYQRTIDASGVITTWEIFVNDTK